MEIKVCLVLIAIASFATLSSCEEDKSITAKGNLVPRTVDEDPSLPSIIVNGAMLHAEAFGDPNNDMVIAIHGGPGADYRYMLNCKDLVIQGYRVVFYDQRGSGLSQRFSAKSYTSLGLGALDVFYNELDGVIAHYRTSPSQKVFLLGHSWGGMLATAYTGKNPTKVQGLVVCEPGGFKWDDIVDYVVNSQSLSLFNESLNDATYLDQFISAKADQHEIMDYKLAMLSTRNDITKDDNMEAESMWRSGAAVNAGLFEVGDKYKMDLSEGINEFDVPVLFLYSEQNEAYPTSWAQKISSVYSSKELFKVPGVGHSGIINNKKVWEESTLPKVVAYFKSR